MSEINYLTANGLQKIKDELHQLKTKGRKEAANAIAEAREKGDLSENAEYDAAKDAQGHLEMRIAQLENTVAHARIIDESKIDISKVMVLSKVKIRNLNNKKDFEYILVSEKEADLRAGKISIKSPIGKGLLGKKVGEKTKISTPNGSELEFEILSINRM